MSDSAERRIQNALDVARRSGGVQGDHHRAWTIDQMVRALTGCAMSEEGPVDSAAQPTRQYEAWVRETKAGDEGTAMYDWDEGIPP